jgi:hypothetical protein
VDTKGAGEAESCLEKTTYRIEEKGGFYLSRAKGGKHTSNSIITSFQKWAKGKSTRRFVQGGSHIPTKPKQLSGVVITLGADALKKIGQGSRKYLEVVQQK